MFPATPELVPDPQFPAEPTLVMSTTVVAHPVDTALDVMVTVIEALPAVVTTMMIVVDTALLQELAVQLMTTHPRVVDLRILTVVITRLTHTSTAELLMIVLHQEIILQEMLLMIMSDRPAVTKSVCIHPTNGLQLLTFYRFQLQERMIRSSNKE